MPSLSIALESYLDHIGVERGLSTHTTQAYQRDLTRYFDFLRNQNVSKVDQVTENHIMNFLETIRDGSDDGAALGASSAARSLAAVRGFHGFCIGEGWELHDPASGVSPPSAAKRLPKAISTQDVERLLTAAAASPGPAGVRDLALLEFLYGTGARISEAINLDIDDLDLAPDRESVRLFGKGRKERIVPVGSCATAAIEAYLVQVRPAMVEKGTGTPAVFVNQRGGRLSRQTAWKTLQKTAVDAGLEHQISPHTFRHSFATHLLAGGADIRVIQDLLGHASVTTTQIYTMVTPETLREVYLSAHPRAL